MRRRYDFFLFLYAYVCISFTWKIVSCCYSFFAYLNTFCLHAQGVNPWIEVDGGVGPKNAYKVPVMFPFFTFVEEVSLNGHMLIRVCV